MRDNFFFVGAQDTLAYDALGGGQKSETVGDNYHISIKTVTLHIYS